MSRTENQSEEWRDCTIKFYKVAVPTCLTGLVTGFHAASGAIGASIMHAAGWTAANGAPIVSAGKVAAASAAGATTVFGPFICLLASFGLFTKNKFDNEEIAESRKLLANVILSSAIIGSIGAGELQLGRGVYTAYTMAAAAVGSPIVGCGLVPLAYKYGIFGTAACCSDEASRSAGVPASNSSAGVPAAPNPLTFNATPDATRNAADPEAFESTVAAAVFARFLCWRRELAGRSEPIFDPTLEGVSAVTGIVVLPAQPSPIEMR